MIRHFFPNAYKNSAYHINYELLYQKGYRGILFDIDNTLVEHGADADERAKQLFDTLKKIGFQTCLISNNNEERVARFNKDIKTNYIYKAGKPGKRGYYQAMEMMGVGLSSTVFIGDQLFTDIYGAKKIGMHNILVRPIGKKEEIQIVLKRSLERIVLHFYHKSGNSKEA